MNAEPPTSRFQMENQPRRPGYARRSVSQIMKLRHGITSLFDSRQCDSLPEYPIGHFKRLVHIVAASQDWTVTSITKAGNTPNFHAARLQSPMGSIFILGHSNFPIICFAAQLDDANQRLEFVDEPRMAAEVSRLFPDVEIGNATDLNRPITDYDLAQLTQTDRKQVNYWKPRTIGHLAFNWWD